MIDFYSEKEIVFYLSEIKKWKKGQVESNENQEKQFVTDYDANKVQEELKNWL